MLSASLMTANALLFGQTKDSLFQKNVSEQSVSTLEDVIVTANKIAQKQNTTGKVVTVITAAQIAASSGYSIAQILNEQAGLNIPGSLSNLGTVPSIYMRGAASGRTLILMDGAPVGDPSMISNEFDLNLVPLNQVEKIEILKGAQSTMYGSDAIGGVINIITKDATKKQIALGMSAGSYGTKNANAQLNNSLLGFKYTVGIEKQSSDGFSSAVDKKNTGLYDKDGYENKSWFIKLQKNITPNWSLNINTKKTAYDAAIDYGAFKDDKDERFKNATSITGAIVQYKKQNTTFQLQYQYTSQDRSYKNDSADKTYLIYENNQYAGKSHFADVFASTPITKNIQLIVGSDFRYGSYNQTYASISSYGPWNENFKDTFQYQNAVYASLVVNDHKNKWILELGGRYNNQSRYGSNYTYTISPSYKLNELFRLVASLSTGFKVPSLYQLSYNEQLRPETSFNTELGVEYKTNIFYVRGVYYNRKIDNGIDYNYINYNFFNYIEQKVNGFELEIAHTINQSHRISANYTLMNGQETNQNRITTTDTLTYLYLLKRPKHALNLHWNYTINSKWDAAVTGRWVDSRYDVGGYATADVKLDDYTLFNLQIQYKATKSITLFANGQNLLNAHFQEINGYNTMGRNFQIGFRLN